MNEPHKHDLIFIEKPQKELSVPSLTKNKIHYLILGRKRLTHLGKGVDTLTLFLLLLLLLLLLKITTLGIDSSTFIL